MKTNFALDKFCKKWRSLSILYFTITNNNVRLHYCIPVSPYIDAVMAEGLKRAEGIAAYFGAENLMPLSEKVNQLEKRLAALEGRG